ncbi:MAG: hypothetical protein U0V02_06025 [Anaerolineales bacterium]
MLAACGVVQPVQQEQPTPVIATVLVTVIAPTESSSANRNSVAYPGTD